VDFTLMAKTLKKSKKAFLEDVVTTSSLPKLEEGGLGIFMIIKAIRFDGTTLNFEHIALCLQSNAIVSFQEQTTDTFQVIKNRMAQKKGGGV
jgi:Mg2+ and Co2+ transporter CorA